MKLVDADGNDVIVTIEGTTITFTVNIYYVSADNKLFKNLDSKPTYALNEEQIEFYMQNIKDAQKDWSSVNEIEYENNKYSVKFDFNFIEAKTITEISENFNTIKENIAIPSVGEEGNPRVQNGNTLIYPLVDLSEYPPHDPAHEFGHLMGLEHVTSNKTKEYFINSDVMGGNQNMRFSPRIINVIRILENMDFMENAQIIKGATKEPDF
jgi:hypothetical protein